MITEKFSLTNPSGEKLHGLKSFPKDRGGINPAVLLLHGLALNLHEPGFDELTEKLVSKNFQVFRIDLSGCGESEGKDSEITITKWIEDIHTFIDYAGNQEGIDTTKMGIVAHSLGGAAVIASKSPVSGLVLLAPTYNFYETMQNVFKDGFNPAGISIRKWSDDFTTTIGPELLEDSAKYDFIDLMKKSTAPLLYVHGTTDNKVICSSSHPLYEQAGTQQKQEYIGKFDHMLNPERDKIFQLIVNWFTSFPQSHSPGPSSEY